ncbi:MAG: ATP phosphoribosyltransferase [Acidobacteriota bacterium]|nr:ATP phosphoribosyltransferase [Acidobacteriota bacterium]
MKLDSDNLKIVLQKQGRLAKPCREILKSAGLDFEYYDGRLFAPCQNFPLDILFLRDDDIPEYVQDGVADLGVVGLNVIQEKDAEVVQLDALGFGACTLSIAVPRKSSISNLDDLEGKRIATSHPLILQGFLDQRKIKARIIQISGSVEITPSLDIADAICDLVSTGSTLRSNELESIETVLESEAYLIGNAKSLESPIKRELIEQLRVRFQSNLKARRTKYVMMNAPKKALEEIQTILPGMKSPTVVPLADDEMVAIHTAVPEEFFWDVIEKLRKTGASDILVVPIEKMVTE